MNGGFQNITGACTEKEHAYRKALQIAVAPGQPSLSRSRARFLSSLRSVRHIAGRHPGSAADTAGLPSRPVVQDPHPFGAAVCLWWLGENFLDIAPYFNDARAGELPLLGGNFGHSSPYGFHDWEFILTESGLLRYDHLLAAASHYFGALLMAGALL